VKKYFFIFLFFSYNSFAIEHCIKEKSDGTKLVITKQFCSYKKFAFEGYEQKPDGSAREFCWQHGVQGLEIKFFGGQMQIHDANDFICKK
jgi:hypothetical protein